MELSEDVLKNSIVRKGNNYRLKQLFKRAEAGEKLTVGFLGGSITQGSLSTKPELCYAYRTFEWFVKTFPKADFGYVNAGIGGTSSQFGVSRAERDLLSEKPDFVCVEFSVNDENNSFYMETYEGLIRKIWNSETEPAIVILHNVQYDTGISAEQVHATVGEYYDIPAASVKRGEYREILAGRMERSLVTPDMLHPNDLGHEMLAAQLCCLLDSVRADALTDIPFEFPVKPLTANRFENAGRILNESDVAVLDGFKPDLSPKTHFWDNFKNGWTATEKGAKISFELDCSVLAVQYRKTVDKPAPVATAVLDGDLSSGVILDADFKETWGDCLYCETVLDSSEKKHHTLEITLTDTHENDAKPFYLLSILYA